MVEHCPIRINIPLQKECLVLSVSLSHLTLNLSSSYGFAGMMCLNNYLRKTVFDI